MKKPKVVILGAGYGGLITSKKLEKLLSSGEAEVTLINKHHYHYLTTQLHKIGAGTATDRKIAMNISDLIDPNKTEFIKGSVSSVNLETGNVLLEGGERIPYDYLLIALGFEVADFGIPGIKENAFEIRSFRSAKIMYNHILKQFSLYNEDHDPSRLTFVIAGGGFTGIELLGELIEGLPQLSQKYNIPYEEVRLIGIEAAQSILPFFDSESIQYTTEFLEKHGIQVMTNSKILECTPDKILLENGTEILTKTLIWSCGVKANSLLKTFGIPLVNDKVPVDSYLRVKEKQNVFCIGDCSLFMKKEQSALPPTAQVALQEAAVCASNIVASIRGENLTPFEYHHKGSVASIGDWAAVGKVGNLRISGLFAAIMKKVIEARYLFILGGPIRILKQHIKVSHEKVRISYHQ